MSKIRQDSITKPHAKKHGFTLVEMMFVVFIFVLVLAMSISFFVEIFRMNYKSEVQMTLSTQLREITDEFLIDGRSAQSIIIYQDFDLSYITEELRKEEGESGKFVVLVESDRSSVDFKFSKLTGYYQASDLIDGQSVYNLYKFELTVPTDDQEKTLEEILELHFNELNSSVLIVDISPTLGDDLFTNISNTKSIQFSGELTRGRGENSEVQIVDLSITARG
jgi:prepilin-type N-terminal cleavage/methylation domain-containing protein